MRENIVLIGFMGTGKTAAGTLLAERLGWKFIDTDKIVEDIAHKSIVRIFNEDGEKIFRKEETKAIKMTTHLKNYIISTGGGAILLEENVQLMKRAGTVILLSATPEKIIERLKDDKTRPLLQVPDPFAKVQNLLKARMTHYVNAADAVVDTSSLSIEEVVENIIRRAQDINQ